MKLRTYPEATGTKPTLEDPSTSHNIDMCLKINMRNVYFFLVPKR